MTTYKPEIVAYVDMLRGQERRYVSLRGDVDQNSLNDGDALIRLSDYEDLQVECEKLRKDAVQGELVGYVRPHHLEMLRSGKVCGVTMEDRPDERNGVTVPLCIAPQPVEQQPVPDVSALVEALVAILEHDSPINIVDTATATERDIFDIARAALAAHRKQGGDQ